jgi:hypothetical protein
VLYRAGQRPGMRHSHAKGEEMAQTFINGQWWRPLLIRSDEEGK